jgi:hypothetical protein
MHKIPLTSIEEAGLRAHGLDVGTPSQLSDVFRHGVKWAQSQPVWQPIDTAPKDATHILACRNIDADGKRIAKETFGLFVQRVTWWEGEGWISYSSLIQEPACFFEPTHWMPVPDAP